MGRKADIAKLFKLPHKRLQELFFQLNALPDHIYDQHPDEKSLLDRLTHLLRLKKGNEKRFISFVVFCTFHAN